MDIKNKPIGIFDSGLGGLTVVKEIIKFLPHEDIIYLGDTARVPYGTRSNEVIKKFSKEDVKFLLKKKVKCVVIACHTSSAVAGNFLKKKFKKVSIFDVVSPVLENLRGTRKRIGVIGTRATINSGVYSKLYKVVEKACTLLVPFIEEGEIKGKLIEELSKKYLKEIEKSRVEILVLGCTHYPVISNVIKKIIPKVNLINPGVLVARELKEFLLKNGMINNQMKVGNKDFYVPDLNERFVKVAEIFLKGSIDARINKVFLE